MSSVDGISNVQAALSRIEAGIKAVRESGRYAEYLAFSSRFHKYSVGNQILIWTQKPEAQMVAGFHRWLELGRHVRKGEKGIMILAPMVGRKVEEPDDDEAEATRRRMFFKAAYVFDVSQTDGEPLPEFATELAGEDDCDAWSHLSTIAESESLTIDRTPGDSTANGYYVRGQSRIWIDPTLSPIQSAKTLAHELSHHFANHQDNDGRDEKEMIAESSAYIVMNHCGKPSDSYSFDYLASWGDDKLFRQALNEIVKTANEIIGRLAEMPVAPPSPEPAVSAPAPVEPEPLMVFKRRPEVTIDAAGEPHVRWPAAGPAVEGQTPELPTNEAEKVSVMPFYGHLVRQLPSLKEEDYRLAANELKARETGAYDSAVTAARLAADKLWSLTIPAGHGYKSVTLIAQKEVERNHKRGLDAYGFSPEERADIEARLARARANNAARQADRNRAVELMAA